MVIEYKVQSTKYKYKVQSTRDEGFGNFAGRQDQAWLIGLALNKKMLFAVPHLTSLYFVLCTFLKKSIAGSKQFLTFDGNLIIK
ncbi:MAG TPA: hypothetical protein VD905_03185 [Flavobacteriales bacterium]|nr:hypothetical protein [Flavobacteriales bacterium]